VCFRERANWYGFCKLSFANWTNSFFLSLHLPRWEIRTVKPQGHFRHFRK
jgi:hypothetical protein